MTRAHLIAAGLALACISPVWAEAPDESGCSFMESMTMNGVPAEFGDVVDHVKDTPYGEKYNAFYSEANKLVNRIISASQIARAAGEGNMQDTALLTAITAYNELLGTEAAAAYIKQMSIPGVQGAAIFNTAAFAFQVYLESRKAVAEKTAATKLESLYGAIEADKSIYKGASSGRKLGEGDPIPVNRSTVGHVWDRVVSETSFRDRFKQYVVQQLQQTFPEPSSWDYFTTIAGGGKGKEVSAMEQDKLLQRRGEVEGWIASLLSELNSQAKATEQEVLGRKRVAEAAQALAGALSSAGSKVSEKRSSAKQKVAAVCKLKKAAITAPPEVVVVSPVPQVAILSTYAKVRELLERATANYEQLNEELQKEAGEVNAALGKALGMPATAPRVRFEGTMTDNLNHTTRDYWNGWESLPMHAEDGLMVGYGTPVTKLKQRIAEYDRAAGELSAKKSALAALKSTAEAVSERYTTPLKDAQGELNGIYQRYAEYIDIAPPYFDGSMESQIHFLNDKDVSAEYKAVILSYISARNTDLNRWRSEAAKVDRKRHIVKDLTPLFASMEKDVMGITALIDELTNLQEILARSRQAFAEGIARREERMRAGAAEANTLAANYENSAAQLIGAWRGLKRIHSGPFFPTLSANMQNAPQLLEDKIRARIEAVEVGERRDAERNTIIAELQAQLAEEDVLVRQFIGAQNNAGPDARALDAYLLDYTGGLSGTMNFGGEEYRADFRAVAGIELKGAYYDIYEKLAGNTMIMPNIPASNLRSNYALVIAKLQGRMEGFPAQAMQLKEILSAVQKEKGTWLGLENQYFSERSNFYSNQAYTTISQVPEPPEAMRKLYGQILGELNEVAVRYYQKERIAQTLQSLGYVEQNCKDFLADPGHLGGPDGARQLMQSVEIARDQINPLVKDEAAVKTALGRLDGYSAKLKAASEYISAEGLKSETASILAMYQSFASAYQNKNLHQLMGFLAANWEAEGGTDVRELEDNLSNSFRLFDTIQFKISGLNIQRVGSEYQVTYTTSLSGRINRLKKSHEDSATVTDTVTMTPHGPIIRRTSGSTVWQGR